MQPAPAVGNHLWSSQQPTTAGSSAPLSDRLSTDRHLMQAASGAHSEGQSGGVAMSGAIERSISGGGGSSGSGVSRLYLSSPPPAPPRQTSPLYLNSATAGSSSNSGSSPGDFNHLAASSSGHQGPIDSPASLSSHWPGAIGSSAAASNSSEDFFFQRDPLLLPRRNHTIGAGPTTSNRRRLDSHFQFPSQGPTSPGQNSLSAITGGQDVDDDDWESMIKSRDRLLPDEDDREETVTRAQGEGKSPAATSAWQPDSSIFTSHHRFSSQPSSAQAASPYYSGTHSPVASSDARNGSGHQRSGSDHVRSLEQGAFASASMSPNGRFTNVDAGMIRRHQSLNHATGRATAQRLQASTRRNNNQQLADRRSPVAFFDQPALPSGIAPAMSGRATPESSSIMDAHARLSRLTLQPTLPIREDSIDSNATAKDIDGKRRLPTLITNREELERSAAFTPQGKKILNGPVSAAAYVPPIGHGHHRQDSSSSNAAQLKGDRINNSNTLQGPFSALPVSNTWAIPGFPMGHKAGGQSQSQPLEMPMEAGWASLDNTSMSIAMLQQRLLQQSNGQSPSAAGQLHYQQALHSGMHPLYASGIQPGPLDMMRQGAAPMSSIHSTLAGEVGPPLFRGYTAPFIPLPAPAPAPSISPALTALIAARGYNPSPIQFDLNPSRARFFVIKSFTEDDVQRSLKYEIWASTEKGNQRLDKAYKECQQEGGIPLYLFFSVNASGHFCGMAQMMTALDYNSSSNVWVQEGKWKGTFKVKWIYVKDVPNVKLRHICLTNTAERKPVTQSRDTQELPTDGGREVLRIMAEFQSKTTLLQDWLFYEQQAMQQQQHKDNTEAAPAPNTDDLTSAMAATTF